MSFASNLRPHPFLPHPHTHLALHSSSVDERLPGLLSLLIRGLRGRDSECLLRRTRLGLLRGSFRERKNFLFCLSERLLSTALPLSVPTAPFRFSWASLSERVGEGRPS